MPTQQQQPYHNSALLVPSLGNVHSTNDRAVTPRFPTISLSFYTFPPAKTTAAIASTITTIITNRKNSMAFIPACLIIYCSDLPAPFSSCMYSSISLRSSSLKFFSNRSLNSFCFSSRRCLRTGSFMRFYYYSFCFLISSSRLSLIYCCSFL